MRVYGLATEELELVNDYAANYLNPHRGQVEALKLVNALSRESSPDRLRLHLTQLDIYFEGYNFCFGLASNRAAVVSTYRLRHPDPAKFEERLRKETIHEIGHILGLGHCRNPRCVMFFSNTIIDTDMKGEEPCPQCRQRLR